MCRNRSVTLKRATAFVTSALALLVAFAVPFAQLRTPTEVTTCNCCPDPTNCRCPTEKQHHGDVPGMQKCHHWQHTVAAPDAPSAVATSAVIETAVARPVALAMAPLRSPHDAPDPNRPAAPS